MPIIAIQEKLSRFSDGTVRASRPIADLARFRAEGGTITQLDIFVDFPADEAGLVADADNIFTMRINGVDQFPTFGDKPVLAGNAESVSETGLSIAVADGDVVSFDLVAAGAAGLLAPVYFRILIEVAGGAGVQSIVAGTNITVDDTDPANPIVSASGGGGGGALFSVDVPYNTPSAEDDEFDGASLDAKWLTYNVIPTLTFDTPKSHLLLQPATANLSAIYQSVSLSADASFVMKVLRPYSNAGNRIGFFVGSSTPRQFAYVLNDGAGAGNFYSEHWSNNTTVAVQENNGSWGAVDETRFVYLRLDYVHADLKAVFSASIDGLTWNVLQDGPIGGTGLGGNPVNRIGILMQGSNTTVKGRGLVDWFRRMQGDYLGGLT